MEAVTGTEGNHLLGVHNSEVRVNYGAWSAEGRGRKGTWRGTLVLAGYAVTGATLTAAALQHPHVSPGGEVGGGQPSTAQRRAEPLSQILLAWPPTAPSVIITAPMFVTRWPAGSFTATPTTCITERRWSCSVIMKASRDSTDLTTGFIKWSGYSRRCRVICSHRLSVSSLGDYV